MQREGAKGEKEYLLEQAGQITEHWLQRGFNYGRVVNDEVLFMKVASDNQCFPLDVPYAKERIAEYLQKGQKFTLG